MAFKNYLNAPNTTNKFLLIHKLKNDYHPSAGIIQKLMIFNLLEKDPFLENWFLQCVKKLIEDPNTTFSCPEGYEDIFDDDDASVS